MDRGFVTFLICVLLLSLIASSAVLIYFEFNNGLKIHNASALNLIDQRMQTAFWEINSFPTGASDNLLFLSNLSSFKEVLNSSPYSSEQIDKLNDDFLTSLEQSRAYYQIRYIDEFGDEVIKVNFDGEEYKKVEPENLQSVSDRHYFEKTMELNEKEVYVSSLDLNIENNQIENRGTRGNPEYVPVMKYATPVFKNGERKGVAASHVYADYFLEGIRRFQREGENTFLINSEGFYLAHPDRTQEFAFMFEDRDYNFANDYPEAAEQILEGCQERRLELNEHIFSYRCIYPRTSSFEIYEGAKKVFGQDAEKSYYWILVTVTDKQGFEKTFTDFQSNFLWFFGVLGVIALVIIVLVYLLGFKIERQE